MRRTVLILVLATACATGDAGRHALRVDVLEQRGQRMTAVGPHAYTIRISNASPEPIEVDSISLAPAGVSDLTFEDAMQNVGDTVAPGETREFEMFVTIVARTRSASQFTSNIDSVNVTIDCRSETGSFVDSEVVSIQRR